MPKQPAIPGLREPLDVLEGKLKTFFNLKLRAIMPTAGEIKTMASFGCQIDPRKSGQKVTWVTSSRRKISGA